MRISEDVTTLFSLATNQINDLLDFKCVFPISVHSVLQCVVLFSA